MEGCHYTLHLGTGICEGCLKYNSGEVGFTLSKLVCADGEKVGCEKLDRNIGDKECGKGNVIFFLIQICILQHI